MKFINLLKDLEPFLRSDYRNFFGHVPACTRIVNVKLTVFSNVPCIPCSFYPSYPYLRRCPLCACLLFSTFFSCTCCASYNATHCSASYSSEVYLQGVF